MRLSLPRPTVRQRAARALAAACAVLAVAGGAAAQAPAGADAAWRDRLQREIGALARAPGLELGVHVLDLRTGATVSHRADEPWYLASLVKLPVAIAVLRGVEGGLFTLDTRLRLRADDRVDGAGTTNAQPIAAPLRVADLLEQMMAESDNTASDMLIGLVGLETVNATVAALAPEGIGPITTLADVRRQVYRQLAPEALQLRGADLLRLHAQPTDAERLQLFAQLVRVPPSRLRLPTLEAAYAAYYRLGLNTGRLDAYAALLAALAQGRALDPAHTEWLLALMERTRTGAHRIKAGLPAGMRFAHKTGTQRHRTCDAGLLRLADTPAADGTVVVACVRGTAPRARAEAALRDVGAALCRAGLLSSGERRASTCIDAAAGGMAGRPAGTPGARGE